MKSYYLRWRFGDIPHKRLRGDGEVVLLELSTSRNVDLTVRIIDAILNKSEGMLKNLP